jgi:hypothetical protein
VMRRRLPNMGCSRPIRLHELSRIRNSLWSF